MCRKEEEGCVLILPLRTRVHKKPTKPKLDAAYSKDESNSKDHLHMVYPVLCPVDAIIIFAYQLYHLN